jgi:hypothetical protein
MLESKTCLAAAFLELVLSKKNYDKGEYTGRIII